MFCNNCSSDRLILIKIFYCWHTNLLPEFHKNVLWRDIGLLATEIFGQRALRKTTQDNIMCVSNLHIHIFTKVLKFGCYDTNLFFSWPSQILMFSLRTLRFKWQLPNVYRVFFYQQLETNLSVSCLEVLNAFVIQVFISLLFFFLVLTGWN